RVDAVLGSGRGRGRPLPRPTVQRQRPAGLLVWQLLPWNAFPVPEPSQKRSGWLPRTVLPCTWLPVGGVPPIPVMTTTPPLMAVSPDGTFPLILLPLMLTSFAPSRAMPTPETGNGASSLAGHSFVLWVIVFALTLKSPAGPGMSAKNGIPRQLSC